MKLSLGLGLGSVATAPIQVAGLSNTRSFNPDGANEYLSLWNGSSGLDPTSIGTNPFTFSAWFKLAATDGYDTIFMFSDLNAGSNYLLCQWHTDADRLKFMARDGSVTTDTILSLATLSASQWYHMVCTRTGTTGQLWLNGVSQGSSTDGDWGVDVASAGLDAGRSQIGAFGNGLSTFGGQIDECAIWDVKLSDAAIVEIYNSGSPTDLNTSVGNYTQSGDLTGWWRFEEGTGATVADSSTANSNTGSIINGEGDSTDFSTDVPS